MALRDASLSDSTKARSWQPPLFRLARTELVMGVRSGAFRFVAAIIFALGCSIGGAAGRGVGMSAYTAGETACQFLGVFVVLWMSLAAVREATLRTDVLVYSKPQPAERLALARFLGAFGQALLFLLALFLGAIVGRWFSGGGLSGFPAYGLQYLRAAGVLFFVASASYCLALLAGSVVAGALIGLYWIITMSGRAFLAKVYFPWYTQNLPGYLLLGVALLGIALWFHRRRREGMQAALWVRTVTPAALLLGVWLLWTTVRDGHDPQGFLNRSLEEMEYQSVLPGERAPGFLLPDQYGRPTSLSDFPDKILLVALWTPRDAESALLLAQLQTIYERYGSRGVLPVAVCLSEDTGAAATFARGESLPFPVVIDWGTHNAPQASDTSPLATAYRTNSLPKVTITDRRRRVRDTLDGLRAYDPDELEQAIQKRLEEEPK